ncbi:MAG: serine hydrolase [Candidatus Sericytochromatia bacterium]|nr:serine hydrolase [Candidatus Sericytochromatia bacterium]
MHRYLFILLLCLGCWMPMARAESAVEQWFEQLPAEAILILDQAQSVPRTFFAGAESPEALLPLHRLSDLLVSQAVLHALEAQQLSLDTPVNYHLGSDLRLLPPAGAPELTLHDLLTRAAGFPLRQSSLFVAKAQNIRSVSGFLAQALTPLPLASGRSISSDSLGDLVMAQVFEQLTRQPLETSLPAFALSQGLKLVPSDAKASPLPLTPALYGYRLAPEDMVRWLQLLQQPQWQRQLLERHDSRAAGLPGSSRGLLSQPLPGGGNLFYLDSEWLGLTQRIGFLPAQKTAFYLAYRGQQPDLKRQLLELLLPPGSPQSVDCQLPTAASGYYRPLNLERRSILAALNPFRQLQLDANGQWRPARWGAVWQSAQGPVGCQIWQLSADELVLREPVDGFSHFVRSRWFETPGLQLGLLAVFLLVFASMMLRGLHDLYLYEPQLPDLREAPADDVPDDLPEAEATPRAGWDLPLLGTLGSSTALSSGLLIFPALLSMQRIGPHLSVAVRDQPSGWLVVALVLPLLSLIMGLILLALLLTEWRSRPWNPYGGRYERLHYGVYLTALLGWLIWLGQFRLLGFAL